MRFATAALLFKFAPATWRYGALNQDKTMKLANCLIPSTI